MLAEAVSIKIDLVVQALDILLYGIDELRLVLLNSTTDLHSDIE